MWILACVLGALLVAPHLVPGSRLEPRIGIAMWWWAIAFRFAVAACLVPIALLYVPASEVFGLLTQWCLHAVLPFISAHLGLSGHLLGDAATLVPALIVLVSGASALFGAWSAARSVRTWLRRSSVGPGPEDSVVVRDREIILAAAGLRRPRVVVSAGAMEGLDSAELAAGLQHEWGHVRRFHRLVNLTASLLLAVAKFLPGGTRAFHNLQFHLERDADLYAVRRTGDPLALASAICKVADAQATPAGRGVLSRLGGSGTPERLRLLLEDGTGHRLKLPGLAGGLLTLAIVSMTVTLLTAVPAVAEAGMAVAGNEALPKSCT